METYKNAPALAIMQKEMSIEKIKVMKSHQKDW